MKNNSLKLAVVAILTSHLLLFTTSVFAHGTGISFEEKKDGYKIDIGHDEFISALEAARFDFVVYPENIDNIKGDIFTDVWVTITRDKKLYFAGDVHKPVFGATGFTFIFPEPGTYIVSARYQKEGDTVTKTEFPLEVLAPLTTKKVPNPFVMYGVIGFAGLLLGVAGGLFIPRGKK